MNFTTVAVDLAKHVFELAVAGADGHISERHRLNRTKFTQFFARRPPCHVVREACGSAHHWARKLAESGHQVKLTNGAIHEKRAGFFAARGAGRNVIAKSWT